MMGDKGGETATVRYEYDEGFRSFIIVFDKSEIDAMSALERLAFIDQAGMETLYHEEGTTWEFVDEEDDES
jgi:hypothetical protein